ncbi:MAG: CBS domain-containing protein [Vicinamibacteria bacterium]
MKVREIMTSDVVVVTPETSVNTVAQRMGKGSISGVPVVDAAGRVVGIVSELDLILRNARFEPPAFFQILDGRIPLETPAHYRKRLRHMLGTEARDVMTEEVVTVGPDEEVESLADLMVRKRVNPIPVIEGGRLVGIVSRADIIRMMARDLAD